MPAPLHVAALELFNEHIEDRLEAAIAFALFLVSEREWANGRNPRPTEAEYARFHDNYLNPHEINRYHDAARQVLADYGSTLVDAAGHKFLERALANYRRAAARGHRGFRGWGIIEALAGAFLWTIVLIVISIVIKYYGIDLIEVYHKVAAH